MTCMSELHAKKILIVEDDPFLKDLLAIKFFKEGVDLIFAESGEAALDLVTKEKPHIILLDLVLPNINGFDVLQRLKAGVETASIHVVVLSNLGEAGDLEKSRALGAAECLIKAHASLDEVLAKVRAVVANG